VDYDWSLEIGVASWILGILVHAGGYFVDLKSAGAEK